MTQVLLNVSDRRILPGLRAILTRVEGVEGMHVVRNAKPKGTKREQFLSEIRHSLGQAKDFKDGNTQFATWEEMMNEL